MTKIRKIRKQKGWNQVDLAYHSRVAMADISRIETGKLKPSVRQIERLARALGINAERSNKQQQAYIHSLRSLSGPRTHIPASPGHRIGCFGIGCVSAQKEMTCFPIYWVLTQKAALRGGLFCGHVCLDEDEIVDSGE